MESFVPFGGFFSTPSDLKGPPRCHLCNEKCEQEIFDLSKGGFTADQNQYQSSLPPWLQMTETGTNRELNIKTRDDGVVSKTKITAQKKWDSICQRLHHGQPFPAANIYQAGSQFPTIMGFQFVQDKKGNADNHNNSNTSENEPKCESVKSCLPMVSTAKNESSFSKLWEKPSKAEDVKSGSVWSSCSLSNSSVGDGGRTSPTSATSVTTDLELGMFSTPNSTDLKQDLNQNHVELPQDLSGCSSANVDLVNESICNDPFQTSSYSGTRDMKTIFRSLIERVGWQKEAVSVISQRVACCQTRSDKRRAKGDIWFNFSGPDRSGKKKIAVALAEILYGSRENFIHVDLSSEDGMARGMSNYEEKFRGKTVVDYVAGELYKKPFSIVFLENVDMADVQVQNTLSRAVRSGKFSDSRGREVSINNAIFVTTSTFTKGSRSLVPRKESSNYSEDRILRARGRPIQMLIGHCLANTTTTPTTRHKLPASVNVTDTILVNKRKFFGESEMAKRAHKASTRYLDLNLPAEENEMPGTDSGNSDNDSISDNSNNWLQDFFDQVDETVVFKPFNFDALAEKFLKEINNSFHNISRLNRPLEIDSKVMEQLLCAAYLSERDRVVEGWIEQVLSRGFVEAHGRYSNLAAHSVVKIVTHEEHPMDERGPGVCLPSRIIVN